MQTYTGGGIGPGFNQVDLLVPRLSKSMENNELSRGTMNSISALLKEMARNQRKKRALRMHF